MTIKSDLTTLNSLTARTVRTMSKAEYREACRTVRGIGQRYDVDALYDADDRECAELAEGIRLANRLFTPRPSACPRPSRHLSTFDLFLSLAE